MKNIFKLLLLAMLLTAFASCSQWRAVSAKDAVKAVQTTTADFYDFIYNGRPGTVKDAGYYIAPIFLTHPDQDLVLVKGCDKDLGYWIPAPAKTSNATALAPEDDPVEEITIRIGDLRPSVFPQRGN